MRCARCDGLLVRVPMYDLPRKLREYACFNCGERLWTETGVTVEEEPIPGLGAPLGDEVMPFEKGAFSTPGAAN